jgi:DNA polymerase-1
MQVAEVMWEAERRGMRVDHKYAATTRTEWLSRAVDLKAQLAAAGLHNPNSNQQIASMFTELGWQPEDFTETGQAVVDKAVLTVLSQQWPELVEEIVEYKQITKWVGAYLDPFADSKGRIHPSINTLRARTGRMSITDPALQTLPSRVRQLLRRPGHGSCVRGRRRPLHPRRPNGVVRPVHSEV